VTKGFGTSARVRYLKTRIAIQDAESGVRRDEARRWTAVLSIDDPDPEVQVLETTPASGSRFWTKALG
jgi:hypothetical protein